MTAPNHALTGALIGLTVDRPVLAMPAAFLSHFVLDIIPHYGPAMDERETLRSRTFKLGLIAQAAVCAVIVLLLVVTQPHRWIWAALGAFLAASPDLFSIGRFRRAQGDALLMSKNLFSRFHKNIQWFERPVGMVVEAVWFIAASVLLSSLIWK